MAGRDQPITAGRGRAAKLESAEGDRVKSSREVDDRGVALADLPGEVPGFTGRQAELGELDRLERLVVVSGTAGVGKTALVVRWARTVRDKFPDGVLFVDLRGFDPEQPLRPAEALDQLLRRLLGPDAVLPSDYAERVARYRALTAQRRLLVVLDNAAGIEQVTDLLPSGDSCCTVITSRGDLAGLVVRYGAVRVEVDRLPLEDAVELFQGLVGGRAVGNAAAVIAMADRCARLPLAVRVAAELAITRSRVPLEELVAELDRHVLDSLSAGGDPRTSVRSVLSWSLDNLPEAARKAFVIGGLAPGNEFCFAAVRAMIDTGEPVQVITDLVRANLWEEVALHRFGMHELLRAYAVEQAAELPKEERDRATVRLLRHYLDGAVEAMELLHPGDRRRHPSTREGTGPDLTGPAHAKDWLETEEANLLACIEIAAVGDWPLLVRDLTKTIGRRLEMSGQYDQIRVILQYGRQACLEIGDRRGEAFMLGGLGIASYRLGRYDEACEEYEQALRIRQEIHDQAGASATLSNLGLVHERLGSYDSAASLFSAAQAISRELGDRYGNARSVNNLGTMHLRTGKPSVAVRSYREALTEFTDLGDRYGRGVALDNLGQALLRLGRLDVALSHYKEALAIRIELGDRDGEASSLTGIGLVQEASGQPLEAISWHERALEVFTEIGDSAGEGRVLTALAVSCRSAGRDSDALRHHRRSLNLVLGTDHQVEAAAYNGYGDTLVLLGRYAEAGDAYRLAKDLVEPAGDRYEYARALQGLGAVAAATGNLPQARDRWTSAQRMFAAVEAPEADEVGKALVAVDFNRP
ncbi:tetratricopeptide repeat protein [Streptomyces sp. SID13031]|uniref:ATP-binding protein n=1 Tax=Streptomyces sp. SID13031 TaxID=2706046 RepID=UPI0013C98B8D|nr:tetratricopeptide repeat protein [Streptomyces sp. SID13031]NEA31546.1 tetratricopeptide repeat protein [Streptomyces sp. SID13031]